MPETSLSHFLCRLLGTTVVFAGLTASAAFAQAPAAAASAPAAKAADSTAPTPLVAAPPSYPVVAPDGSATFHLVLPTAQKVELHLEGHKDPFPMQKSPAGDWTVTVPALAPQLYSYSFDVDGTTVLDPHNTFIKTSFFSNDNVFTVPGHPAMPWEESSVPHGVVNHHYYHSAIVGIDSQYYVYTPPGFDPHSSQKYPVLYLLHGYSDDPSAWTFMGRANLIFDNLIASGKAKPMIVVMPWGYGDMHIITNGWQSWRDPALVMSNFQHFGEALYKEVMPAVKQQYPISDNREDHAIAGLSMGGAETLLVGLNHTDDFAYIGAFSAGGIGMPTSPTDKHYEPLFPAITPQNAPALQAKVKVLWIACGTEDGLNAPNQAFIAWLNQQGMKPTAIHTPGMHAWMVWRDNLSNFTPLLFQK